ncbi:MAG: AAA family ATPase [Bacteroidales bacterium]|nr:AAA family ATPase [Bacteroidales bacterium]
MGIYVNPDNEAFLTSLNTKPYVDKSRLIGVLNENVNTNHANICVSRPRRFGKTMAVEMAYAYYSKGCDSRKLFEKLEFSKSEGWDRYLNKFNVIRLDLISFFDRDGTTEDKLKLLNNKVLHELKKEFNSIDLSDAKDIIDAISVISNETKEKFVIIIDEYDFPIRTRATSQDLKPYLSFLNRLFKNSDLKNAIALAYLTGILPPIADRVESKLNNFTIFTMIEPDEMAPYFGFTSSEVEQLCEQYGLDYNECCRWYDGYKLSKSELCVYNPLSVVEAIRNRECRCYWSEIGTEKQVNKLLNSNTFSNPETIIRILTRESIHVDVDGFLNSIDSIMTRDDILTYLIHLGYLSYDAQNKTCSIPNLEVQIRWRNIIANHI